ncbi:MAG: right-handed parallel beta-helix repeat-containing protein [Candidatus Thorarchaeota archaeon]
MWREGVSIVLLMLLVSSSGLVRSNAYLLQGVVTSNERFNNAQDWSSYAVVAITSNADFVEQGWPGNGTEDSPYVLSNLIFGDPDIIGIYIYNTSSHVIISDCTFEREFMPPHNSCYHAIIIENAANIIVENCVISADFLGIGFSNCSNIRVMNNEFRNGYYGEYLDGVGIQCSLSRRSVICNNSIFKVSEGISAFSVRKCNITGNVIGEVNSGIFLGPGSSKNIISHNRFGWSKSECVSDYSTEFEFLSNNHWTNNSYYDWNGKVPYFISGTAGSVDEFPSLFDDDVRAPWFEYNSPPGTFDSNMAFTFVIKIMDASGVDTASLLIQEIWHEGDDFVRSTWEEHVMHPEGKRYNFTLTYQTRNGTGLNFIIFANDTLGHSRMSDIEPIVVKPYYPPLPPWTHEEPPPIIYSTFLGVAIAIFIVGILAIKESRN